MKMLTGLAAILIPALLLASDIQTAGELFLLGAGARADGLGGCGALLGEASSGLFNPGGQALMEDLSATAYVNPRPYFRRGFDLLTLTAAAHTEFGYIGAHYLLRHGVEDSDHPPEEASALTLAGRPWRGLALGGSFKVLSTNKPNTGNYIPLGETAKKTYKIAFDLGVVYAGLFPQATLSPPTLPGHEEATSRFGRPFHRGLSLGLALLNLGGKVEYDAITQEMLPQLFRGDLLWAAMKADTYDLRLAASLEKLLVKRNALGGYEDAGSALFGAWSTSPSQGGWTLRWGAEFNAFSLLSLRIGWSQDFGTDRFFHHVGLGLGPEWLRINAASVHEPASGFNWWDGMRFDVSANVTFAMVRGWMNG